MLDGSIVVGRFPILCGAPFSGCSAPAWLCAAAIAGRILCGRGYLPRFSFSTESESSDKVARGSRWTGWNMKYVAASTKKLCVKYKRAGGGDNYQEIVAR